MIRARRPARVSVVVVVATVVVAGVAASQWASASPRSSHPVPASGRAVTAWLASTHVPRTSSVSLTYSCAVPVAGTQTFPATASATPPASVGAGASFSVPGYTLSVTMPASFVNLLISLKASSLSGTIGPADVVATGASPATVNVAPTPVPFSVALVSNQPATLALPAVAAGPFTASPSGTAVISPGPVTINGTFPVLGATSIPCTVAAPVPTVATIPIVAGPLVVTTTSLPAGTTGRPYAATLAAAGGIPPYRWALASGSVLPAGLQLDASTGAITGVPVSTGSTPLRVQVTDAATPPATVTSGVLGLVVRQPLVPRQADVWGRVGQEGNAAFPPASTPATVSLPAGSGQAVQLVTGFAHAAALTSTGAVFAWGHNPDGEVGDGTTVDRPAPVAVSLPSGTVVTSLAAGSFDTLAVTATGALYSWGAGFDGQLGDGTTGNGTSPVAVTLPGGALVTGAAAGGAHGLALTSTGAVYAWGDNAQGQLGDGTTTQELAPVAVSLPAGVHAVAVAAGGAHSLALTSTGAVYAWGDNAQGQLGDGTTTQRSTPVLVHLPAGVTVVAIAAGGAHSLALTSTGAVYAWGANGSGQLGDGTTAPSDIPVPIPVPGRVTGLAAGMAHSLALTATGAVYAWGYGTSGQLGDGSRAPSDVPVAVHLPPGSGAIAVGSGPGADASSALIAPSSGIRLAAADGGVFDLGGASYDGSVARQPLNAPIVGMASDPTGTGYWLVASDGGVFAFGGAHYAGSMGGRHLDAPVVGIAPTPDGTGYWLVAADGGVFAFGSAHFAGSMGGKHLDAPVVGMAPSPDGLGYWLVAADGGVFAFGTAHFAGSMAGHHLDAPVVGIAPTPDGTGYWLVAADGGVFAFGSAHFAGSMGDKRLDAPVVGIAATSDGGGYWLAAADGGVFAFGSAHFSGSLAGTRLNRPIVAVEASA